MHEEVNWNLLARYLSGNCTAGERADVEAWRAGKPEHGRLLAELEEVWQAMPPAVPLPDVEALWTRIEGDMARNVAGRPAAPQRRLPPADRAPVRRASPPPYRGSNVFARRLLPVALLFVVVAGAVLAGWWSRAPQLPVAAAGEGKVFSTTAGQRATVHLIDGTVVRLNAASTLTLAPAFGDRVREVRLEGEGYFSVAHDATRPFVVHAGGATAHVLGTQFNVTAYPAEAGVQVVVAEGRVAFGPDVETGKRRARRPPDAGAPGVVLTARQMGQLADDGRIVQGTADLERVLGWMDGHLYFEDASFEEVVRQLGRWYHLDVVVDASLAPSGHLNASFSENQSLPEVLEVIATAFGLRVRQTGSTVRFSAPPAAASPALRPLQHHVSALSQPTQG